jgi:hypothetical protein
MSALRPVHRRVDIWLYYWIGWFLVTSTVLNTAIKTRNQVSSAYFNYPTNELQ